MSPLSRDSFPLDRRSPVDEDRERERDAALRPPRASGGPFLLWDPLDRRVMDALTRAIDCFHTSRWVPDLRRELEAEGLVIAERGGASGAGYVVIYDSPLAGSPVDVEELYYGFFSSPEQARDQYLQMRAPEHRDARVCLVLGPVDEAAAGESHPRHPDPRCKECGELLGDSDRAEVYINPDTLRANAGGQDVLVDDIPEDAFGPYLVHADPCARAQTGGRPTYELA